MTATWWQRSTVYQIYPRSFNDSNGDGVGDIPGIIEKLDYLVDLGIDIIWLSPVYQSPNDDNGYDISDYYAIMSDFGTMEDMERLIAEAHKRNLALIMDLVINHTSDEHPWFREASTSRSNPYRDFYIWRSGDEGPPSDLRSVFSGSAWEYDAKTDAYYFHLFSRKQPDLNLHNQDVRQKIYEMMRYWLEKGINGFRMDVIDLIGKEVDRGIIANGPKLHEYLQEMNKEVLAPYRDAIMTVGETPSVDPEQAKLYTRPDRHELDMVFTFEHMSLDEVAGEGKWALKPLDLRDLKQVLSKWQTALHKEGWNSLYWNNHDQPRIVSRWGDDTVYRVKSAKMLATVLHLLQGTPYIYQGEEIGMTNTTFNNSEDFKDIEMINMYHERIEQGDDPADIMASIQAKGRDHARTPMQWNDGHEAGFTTGEPWMKVNPNYREINAEAAMRDPESIYHYYKQLIQLRKNYEIIVHGSYQLVDAEHAEVFAYVRTLGSEKLLVVANFYTGEPHFEWPEELRELTTDILISNYEDPPGGQKDIKLRPYEAVVYLLNPVTSQC
ncbi:alpha-glucosidase [Thalassobacillus sp. CUG 92003]|uniref:glycoside hydrolase family 13 protein n=1 Tax=Thalassobacillus sp. CUG 92003 TaxID=2736641 RepID=UPI0015E6AB6D|nr:alpha-glucosidase [Thalassobacillus sp. CUG 92003]